MNKEQPQAQVPEEKLEEVSGGFGVYIPKLKLHFVCDACGYEADEEAPLIGDVSDLCQRCAQLKHNKVGGKTGTCVNGNMVLHL